MKFNIFKKFNLINYNILSLFLCLFCVHCSLSEILTSEPISGWDTPGHLYLTYKMQEFLSQGTWYGYDPNWFSGTPLFVLYPPLSYILINLLHILIFSSDLTFSFNFFIYLAAQALVVTFYWSTKYILGIKYRKYVMITLLLFLHTNIVYATHTVGLAALYFAGFIANWVGIILMLVLFVQIRKFELKIKTSLILPVFILLLSLLNHVLSSIFTIFFITLYLTIRGKQKIFIKWICIVLFSFILASPYYYIFIQNLEFSSSSQIGLHGKITDPLLIIFPNLNVEHLERLFALGFANEFKLFGYKFKLPIIISQFPYYAMFAFYFSFRAFIIIFNKKRKHLAYLSTLIILFIFLPRNYLTYLIDLPLHFYRFTGMIAFLFIFIIALGFSSVEAINSKIKKIVLNCVLFIVVLLTIGFQMNFFPDAKIQEYKYRLIDYKEYKNLVKTAQYLKSKNLKDGILFEHNYGQIYSLGSLHAQSYLLPKEFDISIKTGLLAESSYFSSFINPIFSLQSNHMAWGNVELYNYGLDAIKNNPKLYVQKLKFLGVKFVITSSESSHANLMRNFHKKGFLILVKKIGIFSIFKIPSESKKDYLFEYSPFLLFDSSQIKYKVFFKDWMVYNRNRRFNIAYDYQNLIKDYPNLINQFSGTLFVALNKTSCLEKYEKLKNLNYKMRPNNSFNSKKQKFINLSKNRNIRNINISSNIIFIGKKCFEDENFQINWVRTKSAKRRFNIISKIVKKIELKKISSTKLNNTFETYSTLNNYNSFIVAPFFRLKLDD